MSFCKAAHIASCQVSLLMHENRHTSRLLSDTVTGSVQEVLRTFITGNVVTVSRTLEDIKGRCAATAGFADGDLLELVLLEAVGRGVVLDFDGRTTATASLRDHSPSLALTSRREFGDKPVG